MDRKKNSDDLKPFMKAVSIVSVSTNECSCSADITNFVGFWSSVLIRTRLFCLERDMSTSSVLISLKHLALHLSI